MNSFWTTSLDHYLTIQIESRKFLLYPAILKLIKSIKAKRILDFGCGAGELARLITAEKNVEMSLYDSSPQAISIAKNKLNDKKVFFYDSTRDLKLNSYDLIICSLVLMTLASKKEIRKILSLFNEVKKKDGKVIIATTHPCFRQYKFSTFYSEYALGKDFEYLNEGNPFKVHVFDPKTKAKVCFKDYHWPLGTTVNLIVDSGLTIQQISEVGDAGVNHYAFNKLYPPYLIVLCK